MQKVRYEIDPYNRLVDLPKFRKVLDGKFRTDENNNLVYHIKSPLSSVDSIPNQLKLSGTWSLTDDHELRLMLDKSSRKTFGDQITLQGQILDADESSLLFAITTTARDKVRSTYVLTLGGSWKADKNNRLTFHIRKESGKYDILTFNGIWEINKNNQLIYQYEKARLLRKKKQAHVLLFKGYWEIMDKVRIAYVLSKEMGSVFIFDTSAAVFKEKYIQYQIGIRLAGRGRSETQTVRIYGSWSLRKDTGLVFEAEYENGKIRSMVFGANARLTDKDMVLLKLKNDIGNRDIGVSLELSRKIFAGDGEAFLEALASKKEAAIYAGAAWRW